MRERSRSREIGGSLGHRKGRHKARTAEIRDLTSFEKSEEAIVAMKAGNSAGAKGLYLSCAFEEGRYRPMPVRRVFIPKGDGKQRPLGIPRVKDRVVQAAVKLVIEPLFEASFRPNSFGFRPKRSAHDAIETIRREVNRGKEDVIDLDLKTYFDTIDQKLLMQLVRRRVRDPRVLRLIKLWLRAGVMIDGRLEDTNLGTPQGGVISPLLANIYLHPLDLWWEKTMPWTTMVRYADDMVVLCPKRAR